LCVLIDVFDYWVTSSEKYMYYNYIYNQINTTGAIIGAGTAYRSEAAEFTLVF
jgi:hypothetical protein